MYRHSFILIIVFVLRCFSGSAQEVKAFSPTVLAEPGKYPEVFEKLVDLVEISIYTNVPEPGKRVVLENGYAEYVIKNPGEWPPQSGNYEAYEVNLIFTKYPRDIEYWLTNYHWLLAKRLEALFALDSTLNSTKTDFNILYQTDCPTEMEAQQLFHGIEINFRPKNTARIKSQPAEGPNSYVAKAVSKKVERFIEREKGSSDSTVFRTLERNESWTNAVVVMDWTGSMYGYGGEAVVWNALHEDEGRIEHFVFFNDGNNTKDNKKIVGYTGGIYHADANPASGVVRMFNKVKARGNGGDSPENDMEALVSALTAYPEAGEIILVADNNSCIRDFPLFAIIDRPIHIILCGSRKAINPQYVNLAWLTGGTIHTYDKDIDVRKHLLQNNMVLEGVQYTLIPGMQVEPVDPTTNLYKHCNRYNELSSKQRKERFKKDPKCGL